MRRCALISLSLVVLTVTAICAFDFKRSYASTQWTRIAPYTDIYWDAPQSNPYVRIDGEWYELKSIAGFSVEDVQVFATEEYGGWRLAEKRIAEDSYDVLVAMGAKYPTRVSMTVQRIESGEIINLSNVAMTAEKRSQVYRNRYEPDGE